MDAGDGIRKRVLKVMVVETGPATGHYLNVHLPRSRFEVSSCAPGKGFLAEAKATRPDIVVLDRFDERPRAAEVELELLKEIRPEVRVIAVAGESSPNDARLLEQGVFFYMAEDEGPAIVQVIEAAARSLEARKDPGSEPDRGEVR